MILILGASGYVGGRMLSTWGTDRAIGTHNTQPASGTVFFDSTQMRVTEIIPTAADISHAFICFAEDRLDLCKSDINRSYDINVRSTKQVIDDLRALRIKPIFLSSDCVFDGEKGNRNEQEIPNPINVYGSQKLEIEEYLISQLEDYAILRLTKVFGTDPEDGSIPSTWLNQIRQSEEILIANDQVFSPIHVDDVVAVADAVVRLNLNGLFNVSNSESCTRLGFLKIFLECLDIDAKVTECSIRDFDFLELRPIDGSISPNKIMEATGLKFKSLLSCCKEFASKI